MNMTESVVSNFIFGKNSGQGHGPEFKVYLNNQDCPKLTEDSSCDSILYSTKNNILSSFFKGDFRAL